MTLTVDLVPALFIIILLAVLTVLLLVGLLVLLVVLVWLKPSAHFNPILSADSAELFRLCQTSRFPCAAMRFFCNGAEAWYYNVRFSIETAEYLRKGHVLFNRFQVDALE